MHLKSKICTIAKRIASFEWCDSFSKKLASKYYDGNNSDEFYAYEYFFYGVISQLLWIFSGLILSIIFGYITEYCVFAFCWALGRKNSGGMHLDTHASCFITTMILVSILPFAAKVLYNYYDIFFIISFVGILLVSDAIPKRVDTTYDYTFEEELAFRRKFFINTVVLFAVNRLCLYFGGVYSLDVLFKVSTCISFANILVACMLSDWFEKILRWMWKTDN